MARIPSLVDNPRASTSVKAAPTMSPGAASQGYRQAAALSGQIASSLGQLRQQQINEANKVSYTKKSIEHSKTINDTFRELDKEYEGSNYDGFSESGLKRLNKRNDEILKTAPDSIREQLKLSIDSKMVGVEEKLRSREANRKSEYAIFETKDQIKMASQDSYNTWDPLQSLEKSSSIKNLVNSSKQYDERARRGLSAKISNIPRDMVTGVIDRGNIVEMKQALGDLQDKDMELAFSDMDPQERTQSISKLERKIEIKNNEAKRKLVEKHRDIISGLSSNTLNINDPEDREAIMNIKGQMSAVMDPEEASKYLGDIEIYETANKVAGENALDIFSLDVEAMSKEMASSESDVISGAAKEARSQKVLSSVKSAMMREFSADPASYMSKYDKSIAAKAVNMISTQAGPDDFADYVTSMDSAYDRMNVSQDKRKYLAKPIREFYGNTVKNFIANGDPNSAAHILNELDQKAGGDMYKIYGELDLPASYAVVMEASTPEDRAQLMKNIMNDKEVISPKFKDIAESEGNDSIKKELRKDPFYKAMMNMDGGENTLAGRNAEAMISAATVEYKAARLSGVEKDEAVEAAWKTLKSGYDIIPNGEYPIPVRKGRYDSQKVKDFLSANTNANMDFVNKYKLTVPDGHTMEEMNDAIKSNGFWSYNKSSDSLRLLYFNPRTGKVQQASTSKGKGLLVSMKDINNMEDIPDTRRKQRMKNLMFATGNRIQFREEEAPSMKFEAKGYMRQ